MTDRPFRTINRQTGSTSIEASLALAVLAAVLTAGFGVLYGAFANGWVGRCAREAAVCLTTPTPPTLCRRKLENTLETGLPFGRTSIVEFNRNQRGAFVRLKLEWLPGHTNELAGSVLLPIYFPRGRN